MNRVGFFLISDKEEYHFCYNVTVSISTPLTPKFEE